MLGEECRAPLHIVDEHWVQGTPVDAEIGDVIQLPAGATPSNGFRQMKQTSIHTFLEAERAGVHAISLTPGNPVVVRVSRKGYVGRLAYRWEAEPEFNNVG
jgi:hypothetical protein